MDVVKISTRKISEQVAEEIERWIVSGRVQPGGKLPSVRELCGMFAVGRSAVRDAITTLQGKGVVDVRRGAGTFVSRIDGSRMLPPLLLTDKKDVNNVFQVRKMLEAGIAEAAAVRREASHLLKMEQAVRELERADTADRWKADYDFHMAIAEATQNELLVSLMQAISAAIQRAIRDCHAIVYGDGRLREEIYRQHLAVCEAIRQARPDQAREAMLNHLTYVEDLLQHDL